MKAYSWFVIGILAASVVWLFITAWLLDRLARLRISLASLHGGLRPWSS